MLEEAVQPQHIEPWLLQNRCKQNMFALVTKLRVASLGFLFTIKKSFPEKGSLTGELSVPRVLEIVGKCFHHSWAPVASAWRSTSPPFVVGGGG